MKERLNSQNKPAPYEGMVLNRRVEQTFLRGQLVYNSSAGGIVGKGPAG